MLDVARLNRPARLVLLVCLALAALLPSHSRARPAADPPLIDPDGGAVEPLPGGCGRVTPPGATEPACCISGLVFMDGQPIAGAAVELRSARGDRLQLFTQPSGGGQPQPAYRASLSAAPLGVQPGETILITARYSSHERTIEHVVQPGGQQIDLVLARQQPDDYMYQRTITGETRPGQFKGPVDVAVDRGGNVLVLDRDERRVQVFSADGQLLHHWGSYGSSPGQFVTPTDLAVDPYGNVYVADRGSGRVQKFTSAGVYLNSWQAATENPHRPLLLDSLALNGRGEVYVTDQSTASIHRFSSTGVWLGGWQIAAGPAGRFPQGIAVAADGNVLVVDQANQRIQTFTPDGQLMAIAEHADSVEGALRAPEGIALDASGNVYVADTGNQRIQKFSPDGRWLATWGGRGSADTQFDTPQGVAVAPDGTLYVADTRQRRVLRLASDGRGLPAWGDAAPVDRTFHTLGGVEIDASGNVYVTDTGNHRVQKFSPDGRWLAAWGRQGSADGQLYLPRALAVDAAGNVYVSDTGNHRIQKFSPDGRWLATWSRQGSVDGQLNRPRGLVVDAAGNVYVADSDNHRVQKFAPDGRWLATWGGRGIANGQFDSPRDVEIDPHGNLLVVDTRNHRVQKFAPDGRWLATWGSRGTANGRLAMPKGIALDASGNLYVADTGNHRIQKFAPDGRWLAAWGRQGSADGSLQEIKDIAVDASGAVFAADTWDYSESAFAAYTSVYSRLQIFRPMQQAAPVATITYLPRLSLTSADTLVAHGLGQSSAASGTVQAYRWTSDRDGVLGSAATLAVPAAQLAPGAHRLTLEVQDSTGSWSAPVSTDILITAPADPAWTMLLYLAGDYQDQGSQLSAFNATLARLKAELTNPYVRVAVQLDGPADGDTQRLLITPGSGSAPPTVQTIAVGEQAMDDPATLASFVSWGQQKFPAGSYYLAIADHGQALEGIAWDHTSDPSGGAYLTPRELGQALADPDVDTIDVLHLDACAMNLLDVAYEVHAKASLLIASQYLGWSFFAYDRYQHVMGATTTPRSVARSITAIYAERAEREQLPYTIAALNLQRAEPTLSAIDSFAAELAADVTNTPQQRAQLAALWQASQKFESNGDFVINELDLYVDLVDWAERVAEASVNPAVRERAAQLLTELIGPQPFIVAGSHHAQSNNLPGEYQGGAYIDLSGAHGLSVFYPARPDTVVYDRYLKHQFSFTERSRWPDFLRAVLGPVPDGPLAPPPPPLSPLDPAPAPSALQRRAFLPLLDTIAQP